MSYYLILRKIGADSYQPIGVAANLYKSFDEADAEAQKLAERYPQEFAVFELTGRYERTLSVRVSRRAAE